MNRNELVIRASAVGLDPTTYANDSKLEQKVLWLEKRGTTFAGTLATGTLTGSAQSTTGDTTVIGGVTYTYVTALSEADASTTLTLVTTPSDGDMVSIDGNTYVFRTALTNSGTTPYEVLINSSAGGALAKLKLAMNATGTAGTDYGTGTLIHPTVTAGNVSGSTLPMTAKALGTNGNNLQTSVPVGSANASFTGAFLAGGVNPVTNQVLLGVALTNELDNLKSAINGTTGAGTVYSTGTVVNPQVVAGTKTGTTLLVTANDYAVTNASIPTTNPTSTGSVLSWGATTLASGVKNQIAMNTTTYSGAQGVSGDAEV